MYKYILSFVAIIIILAIVIRCNRSNEEELYEIVTNKASNIINHLYDYIYLKKVLVDMYQNL